MVKNGSSPIGKLLQLSSTQQRCKLTNISNKKHGSLACLGMHQLVHEIKTKSIEIHLGDVLISPVQYSS